MEHRPQHKPRGLSFHSNKSRDPPASTADPAKSPKSASKHERKFSDHYDPNSKANPNAAMMEQQPIAAALEKPTLQSLRGFQHTDSAGNPIVDPDLSNPTRSRWERPLDTIRSFEAAIDNEYRRRSQSVRADQTEVMSSYGSRRSSYYGGAAHNNDQNRYSTNSGYFSQGRPSRDNYSDSYGNGGPVGGGPPPRMRYGNRMQSDPGWNNRQSMQGVYPINGYQQSRDTVNTNGSNGSHSDGPYNSDPNSDNSSIERGIPVQPPHQDMSQQYAFLNGFGRGPIMEEYAGNDSNNYSQAPPPPPPHHAMPPSNGMPPQPPKHASPPGAGGPIKLTSADSPSPEPTKPKMLSKNSSNGGEKRKSWLKKRFSRG
ncbi:hypothetical protein ACJQWK_06230 [Exserohilum turcicum]|uniref:Uncharacterized protein n=1 Tax=Exserohilum turcicum (strain 28A) TaxID=671987 RepID=R0IWQ4_EXST2|nr:uncharacterized protein SETTUDRAFT_168226 [Exserohilum turcica Et28A]EOA89026.1 hypothetical protein SETTUDRAFT_168226 [Exserohilum turcica Et28A]